MASGCIAKDPPFAPNQEWAYKARAQDVGSTLIIGAIQDHPKLVRIIHITVRNVNIKNPNQPGQIIRELGHIPISEKALADSVTQFIGVVPPPQSVLAGIAAWEQARGGVFTISVAEAVDFAAQALTGGSHGQ